MAPARLARGAAGSTMHPVTHRARRA